MPLHNMHRILIVEDSVHFAKALAAMLLHDPPIPLEVCVTHTLKAGLDKLKHSPIDLVLTDLSLPDSGGLNTLERFREAAPTKPIVVLTGSQTENLGISAIKLGAQDYLLKGDLTARQLHRSLTYALERAHAQALEAERLRLYKEREDFIATLTHDLKNPLLGSNRVLEMVADHKLGALNDKQESLLRKIVASNCGMLDMICNLLEVYRYEKETEVIAKVHTDLLSLLISYISEIEPSIEHKGIELVKEMPQKMTEVCADPSSMLRVFQNLVENAVKFTPSGGRITVRLWEDEDKALFEVSDTGPGIPVEDRSKLFQRFRQGTLGQGVSAGTGLGLYLCRRIVEAHHGDIRFKPDNGHGCTFRVEIPVSA